MPSGLARSFSAPVVSKPSAAACVPAILQNSRLENEDMNASSISDDCSVY
jgi:hypothetical protein